MKTASPIIQTIITEKSAARQAEGTYAFLVEKNANKIEIKKAIKEIYGADVEKVATMVIPSKSRILKGRYSWKKRPAFKKAIVTLKGKTTIDPNKIGTVKPKKHGSKKV